MNLYKIILVLVGTSILTMSAVHGDIIVTRGASGAMSSTVANAQIENFNSPRLLGKDNNLPWIGVGVISSIYVRTADMFGGADVSDYAVQSKWVGEPREVPSTTLSLSTPSAYFGLWWSAGDGNNVLTFYSGRTVEAQFTSGQLLADLPASYNGNPNEQFKGLDYHEDFAYLNFYGSGGTTWDTILFSNLGASGFESDNWTSRATPWGQDPTDLGNYPGTPALEIGVSSVPEAPVTGLFLVGLGCLGFGCRRRPSAGPAVVAVVPVK